MENGKKLLIAATIPATIKSFLLPYADHFRAKGWMVDAMASGVSSCAGLAGHFDRLIDVEWSRNPLDPRNLFRTPQRIRDIAIKGAYDIVHVHTPVAAFVTRLALRDLRRNGKVKVVYTAHGFHFYKGGNRLRNAAFLTLERLAGRWTDRLVVINREDYEAAKKYKIVPASALVYMPGIGLDFSAYDKTRVTDEDIRNLRKELGLEPDDILFTMIAEFNPGKRHRDVIEALAMIKNPKIHVAFAGEGVLRGEMRVLAKSTKVERKTHFLGHRNDIGTLILASRATLMPSEREGLSRSCMESICLGVPVIGSDARGVRDILQPCRGLVYPAGDAIALRDALLQITEEPYSPVEPDPEWNVPNLIGMHERLYEELWTKNKAADINKK